MRIFGTINKMTKQDDGSLLVEGIASSESRDCQKEIITADAMKAALPDYMKFGNVREMHQPRAAGVATECEVIDGHTILKALIVDPTAILKVESGTYKGFSIGGKVTSRDPVDKTIITGIDLFEISLVDRPANPDAVFNMYKLDNVDDSDEVPLEEPEVAKSDAPQVEEIAPVVEAAPEEQVVKIGDEDVTLVKDGEGKWVQKAVLVDDLSKGSYSIARLAELAEGLEYFASSRSWDVSEGSSSTIPDEARKLAGKLYDLLITTVAEDVSVAKDRLKAAKKVAEDGELAKRGVVLAVLNGDDNELLTLLKGRGFEEGALYTDIIKVLDVSLVDLQKKFDALPAPAKGVLISKILDNGELEEVEVPLPEDPVAKAQLLIKSAHSNGGFLIGPGG
jgi:hypothetical protein